MNLKLNKA